MDCRIVGLSASFNGLVRRTARLPLSLMEAISRTIGHRDMNNYHPEEFLALFEPQFGCYHPFFYACEFSETLKIAKDESKFVFIYVHDSESPLTAPFCRETLCSTLVVEFVDSNFVSWGALVDRGEGLVIAKALKAATFPFCAVAVPGSGDVITIIQKVEGPVSAGELVEILQRTIEEQGSALRALREQEEDTITTNRRIRREQDAAYQASLKMDKEKDSIREVLIEDGVWVACEGRKKAHYEQLRRKIPVHKQPIKRTKDASKETRLKEKIPSEIVQVQPFTKIAIRFPNGIRKEQVFISTDSIRSIYRYVDSLYIPGIGSYQLISNFPRKVYGYEQLDMSLRDAGLHPNAALFLELLHI